MKTAIVTGGASGIGLEFVKLLVNDDYKVFVVDNSKENLNRLKSKFDPKNIETINQDLSKRLIGKFIKILKIKILMF